LGQIVRRSTTTPSPFKTPPTSPYNGTPDHDPTILTNSAPNTITNDKDSIDTSPAIPPKTKNDHMTVPNNLPRGANIERSPEGTIDEKTSMTPRPDSPPTPTKTTTDTQNGHSNPLFPNPYTKKQAPRSTRTVTQSQQEINYQHQETASSTTHSP
jgi:hypothetical protein